MIRRSKRRPKGGRVRPGLLPLDPGRDLLAAKRAHLTPDRRIRRHFRGVRWTFAWSQIKLYRPRTWNNERSQTVRATQPFPRKEEAAAVMHFPPFQVSQSSSRGTDRFLVRFLSSETWRPRVVTLGLEAIGYWFAQEVTSSWSSTTFSFRASDNWMCQCSNQARTTKPK